MLKVLCFILPACTSVPKHISASYKKACPFSLPVHSSLQVFVDLNYLCQSTARSDQAVFNTTKPIWEKDSFHSTFHACRLTIMGMLNELWSNSQLNALKGMPRGPAWKASGVKCLFFKSAANVGCFQVCYCPAGFPFQPTPTALLMWRRVEGRGDGQEKTT